MPPNKKIDKRSDNDRRMMTYLNVMGISLLITGVLIMVLATEVALWVGILTVWMGFIFIGISLSIITRKLEYHYKKKKK